MARVWISDNSRVGFGGASPGVSILSGLAKGLSDEYDREAEARRAAVLNRMSAASAQAQEQANDAFAARSVIRQMQNEYELIHSGNMVDLAKGIRGHTQNDPGKMIEILQEKLTSDYMQNDGMDWRDASQAAQAQVRNWASAGPEILLAKYEEFMLPTSDLEKSQMASYAAQAGLANQQRASMEEQLRLEADPRLRMAEDARRRGDLEAARALYDELIVAYPTQAAQLRQMWASVDLPSQYPGMGWDEAQDMAYMEAFYSEDVLGEWTKHFGITSTRDGKPLSPQARTTYAVQKTMPKLMEQFQQYQRAAAAPGISEVKRMDYISRAKAIADVMSTMNLLGSQNFGPEMLMMLDPQQQFMMQAMNIPGLFSGVPDGMTNELPARVNKDAFTSPIRPGDAFNPGGLTGSLSIEGLSKKNSGGF